MVLKTHLEPFREPLKVPPGDSKKNLFSKSVEMVIRLYGFDYITLVSFQNCM